MIPEKGSLSHEAAGNFIHKIGASMVIKLHREEEMGLRQFKGSNGRCDLPHYLWLALVLCDLRAKVVEGQD